MFEAVGALFSVFVQSFVFLSANSNPIIWGVSTAKLSQSDLSVLRLFFFLHLKKQKQLEGGMFVRVQMREKAVWFLGFFSSCQQTDRDRIHFWVARCKKGVGSEEQKIFRLFPTLLKGCGSHLSPSAPEHWGGIR